MAKATTIIVTADMNNLLIVLFMFSPDFTQHIKQLECSPLSIKTMLIVMVIQERYD
jgi:hypothetical protein